MNPDLEKTEEVSQFEDICKAAVDNGMTDMAMIGNYIHIYKAYLSIFSYFNGHVGIFVSLEIWQKISIGMLSKIFLYIYL